MELYDTDAKQINSSTESFLKEVVTKLTASVSDVISAKDSGHFEIHFSSGKLTRIRKNVTL